MAYSQPVAQARGVEVMDVVDAAEDVKQRVIDTDGEERWVLDDAALEALRGLAGR
jgi:DNA-binding protein